MKIEIIEYTLPDFWACPFINADVSGCTEEDIEQMDNWEKLHPGEYCVSVEDDSSFTGYHDAKCVGVLDCDCSTFIFHKDIE